MSMVSSSIDALSATPRGLGALFFSSIRRHTRLVSDWSSDVCSSDLAARDRSAIPAEARYDLVQRPSRVKPWRQQIGRASCRERVQSLPLAGGEIIEQIKGTEDSEIGRTE